MVKTTDNINYSSATHIWGQPISQSAPVNNDALTYDTGSSPSQWLGTSYASEGLVSGAASSTDNAVAVYNGTTGKLLKNSSATISGNTLSIDSISTNYFSAVGGSIDASSNSITNVNVMNCNSLWAETTTGVYIRSSDGRRYQLKGGLLTSASGVSTILLPDFAGGADLGTLVTSSTETLTNKTLTTPIISSVSNTGTLTLPTASTTLVGRDTTDTLSNKTLTSPIIDGITSTTDIVIRPAGDGENPSKSVKLEVSASALFPKASGLNIYRKGYEAFGNIYGFSHNTDGVNTADSCHVRSAYLPDTGSWNRIRNYYIQNKQASTTEYPLVSNYFGYRIAGMTLDDDIGAGDAITIPLESWNNKTTEYFRIGTPNTLCYTSFLCNTLDTVSATTMTIGQSTATKVEIGKTALLTENKGILLCNEAFKMIETSSPSTLSATQCQIFPDVSESTDQVLKFRDDTNTDISISNGNALHMVYASGNSTAYDILANDESHALYTRGIAPLSNPRNVTLHTGRTETIASGCSFSVITFTVPTGDGTNYAINDILSIHSSSDDGLCYVSNIDANDLELIKMGGSGTDPGASCVIRKADQFVIGVSGLYEIHCSMSIAGGLASTQYNVVGNIWDDSADDIVADTSFQTEKIFSDTF